MKNKNRNQITDAELNNLNTAIDELKMPTIKAQAFNKALKKIRDIVGVNMTYLNKPNYKPKSNYTSFKDFLDKYVNKSVNFNEKDTVTKDLNTAYNEFQKKHPKINTIQPQDIVEQNIDPKTTSNIAATSPTQKSTVKTGSKDDFDVKPQSSYEPIEPIEQINKELNISLLNSAQEPEEVGPEARRDVIIKAYNTAYGYYNIYSGDDSSMQGNDELSPKEDRKIETLRKTFFTEMSKTYPGVDEALCDKAFDAINSHCYGLPMYDSDYKALKVEKIGCASKVQDSLISSANYIFDNMWRTNKDNNKDFKAFRGHVKEFQKQRHGNKKSLNIAF